jgi:hypothetical protein
LLSVGQLIDKGIKVIFEDKSCYIFDVADQKNIASQDERQKFLIYTI